MIKGMQQVVVIHGGTTFGTYEEYVEALRKKEFSLEDLGHRGWKANLQERLGDEFQVIAPVMPCKQNAKYLEWKIWFEKVLNVLGPSPILVGHSLGGLFLAKYLSTESTSKLIPATILVAAVYDKDNEGKLADFELTDSLARIQEQTGVVHLFHSTDDPVVPFSNAEKYKAALTDARLHVFHDRQHFNQEEFPELVAIIRDL